jgi:F-box-like
VTIGSLPDDVLLEIFHFYRLSIIDEFEDPRDWYKNWHKLVHVCRLWRDIVFASPISLNLQLFCTRYTPVRRLLDIWPALPLAIDLDDRSPWQERCISEANLDNFIAALERRDRVRRVRARTLSSSQLGRIAGVMREPFPALKFLSIRLEVSETPFQTRPVLLDPFLNGSASCLQHLDLWGVTIPSLPGLLLSATDLRSLRLCEIPNDGYISPEPLAESLSALTKLEWLALEFQSPTIQPKRRSRRPPPLSRSPLPALTFLEFKGVSEYLEVLAARIDVPQLDVLSIVFFNQLVLDIPQIGRLTGPLRRHRFSTLSLSFSPAGPVSMKFYGTNGLSSHHLDWTISCKGVDWQVFLAAQICSQTLPLCFIVEQLNISYNNCWTVPGGIRPDDIDPMRWIDLFRSFSSLRNLELPTKLEPFIAPALQGLTDELAREVFPALQNIYIWGGSPDSAAQKDMQSFVTARQHSNRPIIVQRQ